MGLIDNKKSMSLKMKIESSVAVVAIIVSVIFFLVLRNGCLVAANLHSNSGNALSTGSDRRVSAELNNTQTVKLQKLCRAAGIDKRILIMTRIRIRPRHLHRCRLRRRPRKFKLQCRHR